MAAVIKPATKKAPEGTLENKVYSLVEKHKAYVPIENDRNRLAFNLYNYKRGEGDPPDLLVKTAKIKVEGISVEEYVNLLEEGLKEI